MGLFSSKKTIVVSSTVYNLAGDEANRPNFLKSSVFSAVMSPYDKYLGETIVGNYLTGPGMKQRQLFNYAVRNDFPGLPTFSVSRAIPVDRSLVTAQIPVPGSPAGLEAVVQDAFVSSGDYEMFAKRYILQNYPTLVNTDYVAEYNKDPHTITIQFVGGSTVTFPAGDYDPNARYVMANYFIKLTDSVKPVITGTSFTGVLSPPSTSGYTLETTTNGSTINYDLEQTQTVTKSYSDGRPNVVTTTNLTPTVVFTSVDTLRTRETYDGNSSSNHEVEKTKYFYYRTEYRQIFNSSTTTTSTADIGGGVIETTTTVTTGEFVRPIFDYRIDTQTTIMDEVFGGAQLFIYKIGTGNVALDALDVEVGSAVTAEFYPFIPVRLNNRSITHADYMANGLYEKSRKLYRKATAKQRFSQLVDQVEDNEDLAEIDYAYVQWGVVLNVEEMACRRYLYQFFKDCIAYQDVSPTYIADFQAQINAYVTARNTYVNWVAAQSNQFHSLYGTPRPPMPYLAQPKTTTIKLKTDDPLLQDFDNRISWISMEETFHTGVGRTGAKEGDVWFTVQPPIEWSVFTGFEKTISLGYEGSDSTPAKPLYTPNKIEHVRIFKQTGANTFSRISIYGLVHENYIYGGKAVRVTAQEALEDTDESGFLVPLHNPTVRALGLVDSTQMATANTFIVFNSYKVYKKKWYQTFLGMLLIFLVVITIAAIVAPKLVGGMSGALGTNLSVGTSLGFSGTGAIVAGAMSNVLAGMLISMVLTEVSVAIFGEKIGRLIASIVSVAISFGGTDFSNLSNMLSPEALLRYSSALANGYAGFVQGNIAEIQTQMFENQQKYEEEMKKLQKMMQELQGNNDLYFDPMQLTDSVKGNGSGTKGSYVPESLDEFIQRTTMTGSDIVDITLSMITDYPSLSLTLPRA